MDNKTIDYSQIKGWGIDADPKNDPTYPMRNRANEDHQGYNWERSAQQPVNMEVLHSNERPSVSAVFGTSAPPSGISGWIRRFAFRFSEGSFVHWIPLLLADRVNVVEGVVDDFKKGHVPNLFKERGSKATWKYNKKKVAKTVLIGAAVATLVILLAQDRKKKRLSRA